MKVMWLGHGVGHGVGGGSMYGDGCSARESVDYGDGGGCMVKVEVVGLVEVIMVVMVVVMGRWHVMLEMLFSTDNTVVISDE